MKFKCYLLFALLGAITFSACSDDNKDPKGEKPDEEIEEYILTDISPMQPDNDGDEMPYGWDTYGWSYEEDKLVSFTAKDGSHVQPINVYEYTSTMLDARGVYKAGKETLVELNAVELENGLVKNFTASYTSSIGGNYSSINFDYHYNAEGYLQSVTGTSKNGQIISDVEMLLTWQNYNIAKIEYKEYGTTERIYTYTYDDKAYIPMSDFSVYTPLHVYAPHPLIEFYTKLGKQSKNNIKEVNMEYPTKDRLEGITKLTYETILNEDSTIKQINHTGTYYYRRSGEENNDLKSFKGIRTIFWYKPIAK